MFDFERIFFLKHKDFSVSVLFPILPYRVRAWKVVEKKSCRIWHKSFKVKRLLTQFGNRQFQEWKSMLLASTLESATFIAIFSDFPKNQSSVQDQDWQPLKNVRMIKQQLCRVGGVGGKYICLEIDHPNTKWKWYQIVNNALDLENACSKILSQNKGVAAHTVDKDFKKVKEIWILKSCYNMCEKEMDRDAKSILARAKDGWPLKKLTWESCWGKRPLLTFSWCH